MIGNRRINRTLEEKGERPYFFIPPDTMVGEIWKFIDETVIPEIKPYYIISNFGRVYNIYLERYTYGYNCSGYSLLELRLKNGESRYLCIHRLLMLTFCPIENSENLQVNHIDGNKQNNNINNLEWCTSYENVQHAIRIGLTQHPKGNEHPCSKINDSDAHEICKLIDQNVPVKDIIKKLNVTRSTVANIKRGFTWKEVSKEYNFLKNKEV